MNPIRLVRRAVRELRARDDSGQVLAIFAGAVLVLMLMMAVVIDISWYWSSSLKIQRAADAAALAGAVTLPNDPGRGVTLAVAEAKKNGYVGTGGTRVVAHQDDSNPNQMDVTITSPVNTFFARVIGLSSFTVSRSSFAQYNLPLKMGSPQNYYGVGEWDVPTISTNTTTNTANTGFRDANDEITRDARNNPLPDAQTWDNPQNAESNNGQYATEDTNNDLQVWRQFGLQGNMPTPGARTNGNTTTTTSVAVNSVQVRLHDLHLTPTNNQTVLTNCQVGVEVWWNGGTSSPGRWLPQLKINVTSTNDNEFTVPATPADQALWNVPWTYGDMADNNLQVRLTYLEGTGCGSASVNRGVALDELSAQANYTSTVQTQTKNNPSAQTVFAPDGTALTPQNFWGAMQSYGAPAVQGDAFMTGFTTRTSVTNPSYDPDGYYNYAVEIPSGASNGEVWIFDPAFCDTGPASNNVNQGTGDSWTVGAPNGASTPNPIDALYELWNMENTPYDTSDDTLVATSGTLFYQKDQSDQFLGGRTDAAQSCSNYTYHAQTSAQTSASWYRLGSGLPAGVYRVHTASRKSTDPTSQQRDATGLNAFSIWAKAAGGAPRVYGLGSMESYFPLPAGRSSRFYLAQIERVYAGKWMDIDLWDPGDTGQLTADLQILMPTTGGYTPASFYAAVNNGTQIPADFQCGPTTSGRMTSIRTSNGNGGLYNGEWLRLCTQIPDNYQAPTPGGETEPGWWKIQYTMGGNSSDDPATDLTTWKVNIRDNPVHLVQP